MLYFCVCGHINSGLHAIRQLLRGRIERLLQDLLVRTQRSDAHRALRLAPRERCLDRGSVRLPTERHLSQGVSQFSMRYLRLKRL